MPILDNASDLDDDASDTYDAADLEPRGEDGEKPPVTATAGAAPPRSADPDKESEAPSDDDQEAEIEDMGVVDIDGNPRDEDGDDGNDDDEAGPDPHRGRENLTSSSYYREIRITPRDRRITSEIMTLFEYCEVIGIRSLQIEKGSPIFTDAGDLTSPSEIARKELFDRKCPLMITRSTGRFEAEEYSVNEMGFPADERSSF